MKIYYLIPDIHKKDFSIINLLRAIKNKELVKHVKTKVLRKHKPVGGIKVLYQHCYLLNKLGFDACLLKIGKYEGNFFNIPVKVKQLKEVGYGLSKNDVVIVPEIIPYEGLKFKDAIKVCFAQNMRQVYYPFSEEDKSKSYSDLGFDFIFSCSEAVSKYLDREPKNKVFLINNFIDHNKFKYETEIKKEKNVVMALPRKNPDDLARIMRGCSPKFKFKLVDGVSESEIVEEYKKADIFLATGYPEGFGLPPLEAMACGAVVVGFTGEGADEYMVSNETALVARDGDCEAAANLLDTLLSDGNLKEKLRVRGTFVAQEYSEARTSKQLKTFFKGVEYITE